VVYRTGKCYVWYAFGNQDNDSGHISEEYEVSGKGEDDCCIAVLWGRLSPREHLQSTMSGKMGSFGTSGGNAKGVASFSLWQCLFVSRCTLVCSRGHA
jgi:hypothetical protein